MTNFRTNKGVFICFGPSFILFGISRGMGHFLIYNIDFRGIFNLNRVSRGDLQEKTNVVVLLIGFFAGLFSPFELTRAVLSMKCYARKSNFVML